MHKGAILVDTTTMVEAWRVGCWNALRSAYRLETVEKCLEEFLTGPKSPAAGNPVVAAMIPNHFAAIHPVTDQQLAAFALRPGPPIDDGERSLWAHAMGRKDDWLICGPDRASMRWGYENGWRERLTSLGRLLSEIGFRPATPLRRHHEQAWLDDVVRKLVMGLL